MAETSLVVVDACEHPQLQGVSDYYGTVVQCPACKKTALIPYSTIWGTNYTEICGIIGLTFGPKFEQLAWEVFGE